MARGLDRRDALLILALVLVLALGTGLRFYRLEGQSLWNDEGTSVALAERSLQQITLSAAADIHPPLYYYLLHYWLLLFGSSDAAARALSALLGAGLLGLIYLLGARLFDRLTGLLAALVTALSSYQVYYAQEARMYMLLTFLGAASCYLFSWGWLETRSRHRAWAIAGWVVITTLAVYTQYLGVALIVAQDLAWITSTAVASGRQEREWRRVWREVLTLGAAQAVVGVLFLPWLRLTWAQLHRWPAVSQPLTLIGLLQRALPVFALGPTVEAEAYRWFTVALVGLALLGLAAPSREGESVSGRLLVGCYWLAPLAVVHILSRSRPMYHPKFLIMAAPGFALLVARGIARLSPSDWSAAKRVTGAGAPGRIVSAQSRWWTLARMGLACTAGLVAALASLPGLRNYYFNPRYARDDYRGIAAYISAVGGPEDLLLINAPSQIETVARYYQGPVPMVPLPLRRPPDRQETEAQLTELVEGRRRVFAIFWATNESDPEGIVEGWLNQHAYKSLDAWYGNLRFVIYAVPVGKAGEDIQHPLSATLGDLVRLEGYSLVSDEVTSGDILQLTLFWRATRPVERRYKVFTHLIDPAGHLFGLRDAEPLGGARPTTSWQEGELIIDRYGLPVLAGTPPGEYLIEIGMYGLEDGRRLVVSSQGGPGADHIILQKVRVVRPEAPPPVAALDMQHARSIGGKPVDLLGFSFGRAGALDQALTALRPGEVAELVCYWQAPEAPGGGCHAAVRVVDQAGGVRLEHTWAPAGGHYPSHEWLPGEIVRDTVHLPLPGDLPPGRYTLLLSWGDPGAGLRGPGHSLLSFVVQ
ncbi:MAG: glycosyltransferase family 39 protein [Anaerolineae bacterium]|nr:glycosyltransferase family 39 protein [Anaerolineae bacterium]